jgi:hypothetical protein
MASQRTSITQKIHDKAGKIMASMILDAERAINVDFLPHGVTTNTQYYSNLLHNHVHQMTEKEKPTKLSKIILLHDSVCLDI